jgi:PAS domain S-box-containing protein
MVGRQQYRLDHASLDIVNPLVLTIFMIEQLDALFRAGPYVPHGHCYLWQQNLVALHALSDGFIAVAYFAIAGALLYFVQRRDDVPFRHLFWLFAAFIASCGVTHSLAVWTLWFPTYWLSGILKGLTALVSIYTAFELVPVIPLALVLPNPEQLKGLNQSLQDEISDRKQAEADLRNAEAQVRQLNQDLECRVEQRTLELEEAKQRIEQLLEQEQQARANLQTAKDNLQGTAERLNLALSAAQMGTWDWHLDHQTQYWSPKTEQMLGVSANTAHTYGNWLEQVHPDDRETIQGLFQQATHHQTEFTGQYRVCWADGTQRWLKTYGRVVSVSGATQQRMVGVLQDITESKRAELSLKASEARFRAVFEQAAVGMARLSLAGNWIQVNQRLGDILGYRPEAMVGRHFSEFTWEDDKSQDAVYHQQLLAGETTSCQFEKRYVRQDDTPVWTLVTVSAEQDAEGKLAALIAIVEDIEDRKAARQELLQRADELAHTNLMLASTTALLEQRNAELDQFAYVASHDLKAPLRAISNLAEWLGEDLSGRIPDENQHQLNLLRGRVQRMESLINGLLEYSRVGRRQRTRQAVDLNHLLNNIVDSLAPSPGFTVALMPHLPSLYTSESALSRVLTNLIDNALKHHHRETGTIQVSCTARNDGMLEFAITDDGPGIDPQYHDRIFTIFQTLKARDDFESTGIGLAVVRKIIEGENGQIWLKSTPGEGTTFYFTWPQGTPEG